MDAALSVTVLSKIRKTADLTGADDTEALTHAVRERLAQQSALVRRTLRAFPYARLYNTQIARELHKRRLRLRAELKQKRRDLRTELQRAEQKLRDDLKKGRD